MKKFKKPGSLNGLGIGAAVVLGIIMMVHVYIGTPDEPIYMRLIYGAFSCFCAFIGSGVIALAVFAVFYVSMKINNAIFVQKEDDDDPMDNFLKTLDILLVACFIASYIICFMNIK